MYQRSVFSVNQENINSTNDKGGNLTLLALKNNHWITTNDKGGNLTLLALKNNH